MELILSPHVAAIQGSIGKNVGYAIQRRKNRFFAVRSSRGYVPTDGHLRFIFTCADLARIGLHITDVKLSASELHDALVEAGKYIAAQTVRDNLIKGTKTVYNARDINNLKHTFGL